MESFSEPFQILSESNQIFSIILQLCSTMHEVMRCSIPDCSVIQQSDLLYERTLRYYLSKLISLWGASKSSYVVYTLGLQLYTQFKVTSFVSVKHMVQGRDVISSE